MRPGRIAALALAVTTAVVGIALSGSAADAKAAPLTTRFAHSRCQGGSSAFSAIWMYAAA